MREPARPIILSLTSLAGSPTTKKDVPFKAPLSSRKGGAPHPRSIIVLVTLFGGMILMTVIAPPTLGDMITVKLV